MQLLIKPLGSGHGFNVGGSDKYRATAERIQARLGACACPLESYRFCDTKFIEQMLNKVTSRVLTARVGMNPDADAWVVVSGLEAPVVYTIDQFFGEVRFARCWVVAELRADVVRDCDKF